MSESIDAPAMATIRWPAGLDEQAFLARFWQRQPLLMPGALPDFVNPLPADELAGLALEPDTTPRLVLHDADDGYRLESGPFEANRFDSLGPGDWSLLVTDVDKHLPELADWLTPFRFLPSWRMDDLMISHAPDGASVGAHVDEYDVFLLQASGTRRWSIDARPDPDRQTQPEGDLRLLSRFQASETHDLHPGDMLYLPPGVPHHGVAIGEQCMTWSIGFRAPSAADLLNTFIDARIEALDKLRYRDPGRVPVGIGEHGLIDTASLARVEQLWRQATTIDDLDLAMLAGTLLTRASDHLWTQEPAADSSAAVSSCRLHPFCRAAWLPVDVAAAPASARLFVDGDAHACSVDLARQICSRQDPIEPAGMTPADRAVIEQLLDAGRLVPH